MELRISCEKWRMLRRLRPHSNPLFSLDKKSAEDLYDFFYKRLWSVDKVALKMMRIAELVM